MSGAQRRKKKLANNILRNQLKAIYGGFDRRGNDLTQVGHALSSQMKSISLSTFASAERMAAAQALLSSRKSINEMVELKRAGKIGMHKIADELVFGKGASSNNVLVQFAQHLSRRDVGDVATKFTADLCDVHMNY